MCPTLWNPMESSPPGSSVHDGISQARILEWVVTAFSRGSSQPRDWTCVLLHCRWILYHWATREALVRVYPYSKMVTTGNEWLPGLARIMSFFSIFSAYSSYIHNPLNFNQHILTWILAPSEFMTPGIEKYKKDVIIF